MRPSYKNRPPSTTPPGHSNAHKCSDLVAPPTHHSSLQTDPTPAFRPQAGNRGGIYGFGGQVPAQTAAAPVVSFGVIAVRVHPSTQQPEYLLICRRNTLGYMDFIRGKMPLTNKQYLLQMFNQMTLAEKTDILARASNPEPCSKEKLEVLLHGSVVSKLGGEAYNAASLIAESDQFGVWAEPEWGFPKGKRNGHESDAACALREFGEETGFSVPSMTQLFAPVPTAASMEETFVGSNTKTYCHKYMVMTIPYAQSLTLPMDRFQGSEVSAMRWLTYEQCLAHIRGYNTEKRRMLSRLHAEICANLRTQVCFRGAA